jgi:ParB/RepB/Spo0J family partition protein
MTTAVAPAPTGARPPTFKTIPVGQIDRDPTQPRQHFDPAALDELAESMLTVGQLQPVVVRLAVVRTQAGRFEAPRYVLVMGERRLRAALLAGITTLRAMVSHDDASTILAQQMAENMGRVDMTPMEEAAGFARLTADGYEVPQIAAMCGKSVEYVGYRIELLNLIDSAQEALNRGHLLVGTAWYVARLSPAAQQRFLHKLVRGEFPTARDAEAFAQACRNAETNQQTDIFGEANEMSEERKAKVTADRARLVRKVDQLANAGQILSDLARTDPAELALLLASLPGGVTGYRLRAEHIRDAASKAAAALRKAGALAAVAGIDTPPTDTLTFEEAA